MRAQAPHRGLQPTLGDLLGNLQLLLTHHVGGEPLPPQTGGC